MASITRHKKGWRAFVSIPGGKRRSKTFRALQEARKWAAREEHLAAQGVQVGSGVLFEEILERYGREVSPTKRGVRWEILQIERMKASIGQIEMDQISAKHIAAWRDARLRDVAPATVRHEMNLLGAVFTVARQEWGALSHNPMEGVRKPKEPPPRDRLPQPEELERLAHAAGDDLSTATARAWHAFRFASETAMRAGEIVGLTWADIDLEARVAELHMTKNGRPRSVPLSSTAVDLLRELPDLDPVFGLTTQQLDALFRKLKAMAQVDGLRFHDSRAFALTKLSRKVDVMTLAKISGHRDLRILLNTYYRETAADIAARLD